MEFQIPAFLAGEQQGLGTFLPNYLSDSSVFAGSQFLGPFSFSQAVAGGPGVFSLARNL